MRNILKKAAAILVLGTMMFSLSACKDEKKEFAFTTERKDETMMPTVTYGCDLYTADLRSLKKMSGTIYKGGDFGKLDTAEKAFDAAIIVVSDIYGYEVLEGFEPYIVTENERAGCWIIHGSPKTNLHYGVSFVAIKKENGEVVMVLKNPLDEEEEEENK